MTAAEVTRFLAESTPIKRDRWGNYVLPHPDTGAEQSWTRVTTVARAGEDQHNLTGWKLRTAVRGMAERGDLAARLCADYGDDRVADAVVVEATEYAGGTVAATYGTAMHRFTELADGGETIDHIPGEAGRDLAAYREAIEAHGLVPVAIEAVVCLPDLGVAGTLDRVMTRRDESWITDLKTGARVYWDAVAVQLALYANATHIWNGTGWDPMPHVDRSVGLVVHLPRGEATCTVWQVDIAAGWEAVNLCMAIRAWRKRRDLSAPFDPDASSPTTPAAAAESSPSTGQAPPDPAPGNGAPDRVGWITGRLRVLAGDDRAKALVAQLWPDGVTVKPPWSTDQIDALAGMLDRVEAAAETPFGATDPGTVLEMGGNLGGDEAPPEWAPTDPIIDDGVTVPDEDATALGVVLARLPADHRARVRGWERDATTEARSFASVPMTRRMWTCARAALSLAGHDDDAVTAVLSDVLGRWEPTWRIGPVIGSLTINQAEAVADRGDQ